MTSPQILIIDDDSSFIELLELNLNKILKSPNFTVFNSLTEAEEFLSENQKIYELVIIDQHLPDGKGSDFIKKGHFLAAAVLSMSSDQAPDIPAQSIGAGATFFLHKQDLTQPLFEPLVHGLIQRNQIAKALQNANQKLTKLDTIKKMISTLQHEINNPLAAIVGALFILKRKFADKPDEQKAIQILEDSSNRIKTIIENLQTATDLDLEETTKGDMQVYQIPGDKKW